MSSLTMNSTFGFPLAAAASAGRAPRNSLRELFTRAVTSFTLCYRSKRFEGGISARYYYPLSSSRAATIFHIAPSQPQRGDGFTGQTVPALTLGAIGSHGIRPIASVCACRYAGQPILAANPG